MISSTAKPDGKGRKKDQVTALIDIIENRPRIGIAASTRSRSSEPY